MTWNHRVVEHYNKEHDETTFNIHEIYYDDNGDIEFWTSDPVYAQGDDLVGLHNELVYMLAACQKPVLKATELPGQTE